MKRKKRLPVEMHPVAEWATIILLLLFGTAMVAQPYVIPTPSMEGNLLVGDHLLVDKLAYAPAGRFSQHLLPYQEVERGDIVVFRFPLNLDETYVKRAIGLPGDRIRIVNGQVYLNGVAIEEPYKKHVTDSIEPYRDNFPSRPLAGLPEEGFEMLRHIDGGELVVPTGHYFMLGDNRDNSLDSRYWGFVPRANIVGTPVLIWWSYEAPTETWLEGKLNPKHWFDVATNFVGKTRWDRVFQVVRSHRIDTPQ